MEALTEALGACLSSLVTGSSEAGEAKALEHLQGVVQCLSAQGGDDVMGHDEEVELLITVLRDTAWQLLQEGVDRLDPTAYSRGSVVQLLGLMGAVTSQQVSEGMWSVDDYCGNIHVCPTATYS